ncbi:hypothetical protein FHS19_006074 [Paenibacillus rhizosphaerae]|uniref:SnoaL-like domain-containing protein n=1 Tax=Paenibacillus rhizosphaerae TaxID=297318 RepID=A0A839TW09_9BACL|nr:hypothetical protein [Paenibacillus rhizosphaerae]MBB3131354.1 hypothetical protein [Paenibacillus rhizosphaerae]
MSNQQTIENQEAQQAIRESAQDTFRNHLKHLSGGNIEAWVDLWQEDGMLEFPYRETGNPYNQTYISVVRTKDGPIESYRDFWNPLVAIESVGIVSDVVRFSE